MPGPDALTISADLRPGEREAVAAGLGAQAEPRDRPAPPAADVRDGVRYADGFPVDAFLALAARVWPRAYDRARAAAALARTANVGAWVPAAADPAGEGGDRLVGAVRVLTDGYCFATVPEILVDPAYQRRGLGRALMDRALAHAPGRRRARGCLTHPRVPNAPAPGGAFGLPEVGLDVGRVDGERPE